MLPCDVSFHIDVNCSFLGTRWILPCVPNLMIWDNLAIFDVKVWPVTYGCLIRSCLAIILIAQPRPPTPSFHLQLSPTLTIIPFPSLTHNTDAGPQGFKRRPASKLTVAGAVLLLPVSYLTVHKETWVTPGDNDAIRIELSPALTKGNSKEVMLKEAGMKLCLKETGDQLDLRGTGMKSCICKNGVQWWSHWQLGIHGDRVCHMCRLGIFSLSQWNVLMAVLSLRVFQNFTV